ncbi:sulfurtransferase complex subunit TusC [Thiotrichales bacterium 19S3-7]|nr:sulfurtransferase complex subunit TusC [Thiotrichales bacterium 19S3-7]MCF6800864.1 sulfurtransferase complex subunit TusC [Thiotrichales bacterium 19S3-11]
MNVLTIVIRSSPYQYYLTEVQDLILAQSAFFDHLNVIFIEDGLLQLIKEKKVSNITHKDFSKAYETFSLYDIDSIYVQQQALKTFNLEARDLLINTNVITNQDIKNLLADSNFILNF